MSDQVGNQNVGFLMTRLILYCLFCCLLLESKLFSGIITSVGEERAYFLLSSTCSFVVSVRRGFLCLWVLTRGCVSSLGHSLGLPYIFCFHFWVYFETICLHINDLINTFSRHLRLHICNIILVFSPDYYVQQHLQIQNFN